MSTFEVRITGATAKPDELQSIVERIVKALEADGIVVHTGKATVTGEANE